MGAELILRNGNESFLRIPGVWKRPRWSYLDGTTILGCPSDFPNFIQAGVIGFVSFLLLLMRFLKDIFKESIFLASMVPLLIYALGGDILRRLPVWILILLMYAIKYVRSNDATILKSHNLNAYF